MEELQKEILNKKMDTYSLEINDFKAISELTVEITLNEYRKLIKEVSTKKYDIDKANIDKWTIEDENEKLKDRVKDLEIVVLKYKNKYGELEENTEEE